MHLTSGKISEFDKLDVGVAPVSLASTVATGAYHSMAGAKKALFRFTAAAMAATKTVVAQVMQATSAAGAGAAALAGAAATITANIAATKVLITANTIATGVTINTINDIVFSCIDAAPDASAGEYASGADDTAACVNLAAVINQLLGTTILATPSGTTVILTAKEPGEEAITAASSEGTTVTSTLEAQGFVEIDAAQLSDGFSHVALKLTTDATIVVAGDLIRGSNRFNPVQQMAASTVL